METVKVKTREGYAEVPKGFGSYAKKVAKDPADPDVLKELLEVAGVTSSIEEIKKWSLEARIVAEIWASQEYLRSSNPEVRSFPRPWWIPDPWQGARCGINDDTVFNSLVEPSRIHSAPMRRDVTQDLGGLPPHAEGVPNLREVVRRDPSDVRSDEVPELSKPTRVAARFAVKDSGSERGELLLGKAFEGILEPGKVYELLEQNGGFLLRKVGTSACSDNRVEDATWDDGIESLAKEGTHLKVVKRRQA